MCRRCRPPPAAEPPRPSSPPHPVHPPSGAPIFLLSIFGYLVFCIFYKWSVDWVADGEVAPSLITMLIQMFMRPGVVPAEAHLFRGQATVQLELLALAFVCVPWMLLAKPLIMRQRYQIRPVQTDADAATLGRAASRTTATPTAAARRPAAMDDTSDPDDARNNGLVVVSRQRPRVGGRQHARKYHALEPTSPRR